MLSNVVLCYAKLCYVMPGYAMLCYVLLCYAVLSFSLDYLNHWNTSQFDFHFTSVYAMICYVMHATLCCASQILFTFTKLVYF